MLALAICDDNPIFLEEVRQLVTDLPQVRRTACFISPEDMMQALTEERFIPDLILMDLQYDDRKTGLDWAEELRQVGPNIGVICVTGYNDRYAQHILLHNFNLVGYLTKPLDRQLLCRYLDKALEKQQSRAYFPFILKGKAYSIATDSILFIESNNHTVTLYTDDDIYTFYDKLSILTTRLPASFAQCHKSYLVNLNHIVRLEPRCVTMSCGRAIPVSKAFFAQLQEAFFYHIGQEF